ncbi:MAG: glycosyltransferase family 87 protein, partial [Candidatus Korobacteraceae bacterium]
MSSTERRPQLHRSSTSEGAPSPPRRRSASLLTILLAFVLAASGAEFLARSLVPAYQARSDVFTDFAEPYAGAKLLLEGRNPYDVAGVGEVLSRHVVANGFLVPLNVPSFYLLAVPFSFLPWHWANFFWALCGVVAVAVVGVLLLRLSGLSTRDPAGAALLIMVALFAPFHTALHVGNGIVICCALLVGSVFLASRRREAASGIALTLAAAIKPQLGLALLLYFLLQRRWKVVGFAFTTGIVMVALILLQIVPNLPEVIASYRTNSEYWFGGQNDFSPGSANRLHLINLQLLLANVLPGRALVNGLGILLGLGAIAVWAVVVLRRGVGVDLLAIATGMAASLLPFYHRNYDAAVLVFALGWSISNWWSSSPRTQLYA